jgi:hypothetical protein
MNRLVTATAIDLRSLHREAIFMRIMGVNYVHVKTDDESDLYVTPYGVPFFQHLLPENWYEKQWFTSHRARLSGTGTVYHVTTRPLREQRVPHIELVVKWSRIGQEVALDTFTLERNCSAEFNSPFEEFSLVEELRQSRPASGEYRVLLQKPLAIYVPSERLQPWQTGRFRDKIIAKEAKHPGVLIDVLRAYILLYGWIKGIDAVQSCATLPLSPDEGRRELESLTRCMDERLRARGFVVSDHKPAHLIMRPRRGKPRHRSDGSRPLAIVDYELLSRTPESQDMRQARSRAEYLARQRDRFLPRSSEAYPTNLKPCHLLDVDYVVGRAESTDGTLWVVGNDPGLFAYFLPERWRGGQISLSASGHTLYTQTKDRLHLVWRVSRVGELPPGDLADARGRRMFLLGYNSPFEEFAIALAMSRCGIKTTYPRAIYMTASPGDVAGKVLDDRRFQRMHGRLGPNDLPILPPDHDYITIWGYWRGLDDADAVSDQQLWTPIDAGNALRLGLIGDSELVDIMLRHHRCLHDAGFDDPALSPDHLLLSYIPGGSLRRDDQGLIDARHCSFAMTRQIRCSARTVAREPVIGPQKTRNPVFLIPESVVLPLRHTPEAV